MQWLHRLVIVFCLCLPVDAVPRESPDFDAALHVPDISDSESVPLDQRRESETGCHWTARLQLSLCGGDGECHDAEILAFDFQRRAWAYYESNRTRGGISIAPPLEEAFWIAAIPMEEWKASLELCPGLVIVGLLLVAEVQFAISPYSANLLTSLNLAKRSMSFLQNNDPREFEAMQAMWPIDLARDRADEARNTASRSLADKQESLPSVDIVIARCSTSLRWLWELPLPKQARIIVYEKCERPEGELESQLSGLHGRVAGIFSVLAEDHGEWMTGECGAYLQHVIAGLTGSSSIGSLADYTIFIHDDAPRHLKPSFLSIVFRSLDKGSYDVPFLNLAHERYLQMATPCLRELYKLTFERELEGRLSTYCCGHFVVNSARISASGRDGSPAIQRFSRLWKAVSEGAYTAKAGGQCEVAHMPCYVVEHIWHVLFGEEDMAPWRSEDTRLPLHFRYEGGRETRLASPLKFTAYMQGNLLK